MNYHVMMKEYKDADILSKVDGSSKHEFIQIVLEELHYNLKVLVEAISNEGKLSKNKSRSFSKIITSLMILMDSLDFDKGKKIADNLYSLYDYCRRQVLDCYKNQTIEGLNSSINVIDDILSAWKQIK
tara:strand:- start:62 stop:445 length:384 start_codon:yes stop_codon:yes gene_type:complete